MAPDTYIFQEPVDPFYTEYYAQVKKPLDFAIINLKLSGNQYSSATQFIDDLSLMFNNNYLYYKVNMQLNVVHTPIH